MSDNTTNGAPAPEQIGVCGGCYQVLGPVDGTLQKAICAECAREQWAQHQRKWDMHQVLRDALREFSRLLEPLLDRHDHGDVTMSAAVICLACGCRTTVTIREPQLWSQPEALQDRLGEAIPLRCPRCNGWMGQHVATLPWPKGAGDAGIG